MNLTDSRTIDADIQTVWRALLDPDVLRACVPGCQEMTGSPEEGFEATVVQKVGPVKATFKGHVTLEDMNPPESLTIAGEGKGGPAGFARGGAKVRLEEQGPATTVLHYDVEAKVGGKLAQLGSRIIDGFAKKMADQFFQNFQDTVAPTTPEPTDSEAPSPALDAAVATDTEQKKGWFARLRG
ncbi:carbon monoxide dehydrogenase subunit G [Roseobacter sp. HKCCA0434]|uniref:CoxG family protein n=1 Tax=Roseobacter sp. HKCCA0434 TaxID=3079297 RepID=UPI002905CC05|nr:carbon monoxide dehydrogenase subunit G [Roseobacter sp. HKCCA0434]